MSEKNDVEEEDQEEVPSHEGLQKVFALTHEREILESPIDLHLPKATAIELPPLEWHHMEVEPKRVKLTNSGHTVIYSAKWIQERPCVSGGPFTDNYVFSQLHFHWGNNNMCGSEHTISGVSQILEMHMVYFKSCYQSQESASQRKDGIAMIVYIFKLQDEINEMLQVIIQALPLIKEPHSSTRLRSHALGKYMAQFEDDYFLYAGSINTTTCVHYVLWLISRVPMGVSMAQVEGFRLLMGADGALLSRNFRDVQPLVDRTLYHVNPSGQMHSTLIIMQKEVDTTIQRTHQTNKYPRSSHEYSDPTGTTI